MSSKRKDQYLFPGFIWLSEKGGNRKTYQLKLDKEIKSHFSYVENKQNKQRGFHRGELSNGSSLALYISRYLGDGIYSSADPQIIEMLTKTIEKLSVDFDSVYLLVVANGKVLEGTDIILKRDLFNIFINQLADTEFSALKKRDLTKADIFELNRNYISDMMSENKYSNVKLGLILIVFLMLCGGGMAWFILMA
ncbi:hypothetical protein EOG54_23905 [Salmonella enterica]|nr:hypothetical protein [Salmonella enterica]ECE8724256.1 hypothetical protein [Salmonella enterica subsp. enterica serovar Java]EDR9849092.1 hypothetical protein [Salmonella enterica subsp. enterica]EAR4482694.1 hypothetical protein [Salmonella enterica]EAU8491205.1 hypothetical protein [Salmonella enterica]